jgi:acetyl-CoA carboxylase biotin carboxyl carrier protein
MLTPADLRDIVKVLDSTSLDEFHVETDGLSITLRRHGVTDDWTVESTVSSAPEPLDAVEPTSHPAGADQRAAPTATTPPTGKEHLHRVTPPLLGTFYRAPKPGAAPFVEVGSTVEPDTVVGIIETMKMMSTVYAGVTGTIVEICLADAQFAEPDTPLMLVEVAT